MGKIDSEFMFDINKNPAFLNLNLEVLVYICDEFYLKQIFF